MAGQHLRFCEAGVCEAVRGCGKQGVSCNCNCVGEDEDGPALCTLVRASVIMKASTVGRLI